MTQIAIRPIALTSLSVGYSLGMNNNRRPGTRPENLPATEASIPDTIVTLNYRCPVCGEMVDPSSAEQILIHHEHATHPRDFFFPKVAVA